MAGPENRATVVVDGYTRFCLTAIVVLLTLLIVGLWAGEPLPTGADSAVAADRSVLPNAGAQRIEMIEAIQGTNRKLDQIMTLLQSGKVRVTLVEAKPAKEVKHVAAPPKEK